MVLNGLNAPLTNCGSIQSEMDNDSGNHLCTVVYILTLKRQHSGKTFPIEDITFFVEADIFVIKKK